MRTRRAVLTSVAVWAASRPIAVAMPLLVGASRLYRGLGGADVSGRVAGSARVSRRSSVSTQAFEPRWPNADTSGFAYFPKVVQQWKPDASLEEISKVWHRLGYREVEFIDGELAKADQKKGEHIPLMFVKATFLNCEGEAEKAYQVLEELRSKVASDDKLAVHAMGNLLYFQGVTGHQGEDENCIMCRGTARASCPSHRRPFTPIPTVRGWQSGTSPNTSTVPRRPRSRWLLNLTHMTLGEYPEKVDPRFRSGSGPVLPFGIRHRQVSRRRPPGGRESLQSGRRRDHGRF